MYLELHWDLLLNFSIEILIALMWAQIPSGPDNFKRVIKRQEIMVVDGQGSRSMVGGRGLVVGVGVTNIIIYRCSLVHCDAQQCCRDVRHVYLA